MTPSALITHVCSNPASSPFSDECCHSSDRLSVTHRRNCFAFPFLLFFASAVVGRACLDSFPNMTKIDGRNRSSSEISHVDPSVFPSSFPFQLFVFSGFPVASSSVRLATIQVSGTVPSKYTRDQRRLLCRKRDSVTRETCFRTMRRPEKKEEKPRRPAIIRCFFSAFSLFCGGSMPCLSLPQPFFFQISYLKV